MKQNLWIISELFYPEETSTALILTELAIKLSEKYNVKVIAGEPVYDIDNDNIRELPVQIEIHRIKGKKINKNNVLKRLIRASLLRKQFSKELESYSIVGDKVLAVTNPVFNILGISKICQKKKLYFTILVQDIFPENSISAGLLKIWNPLYTILVKKFNNAYRRANKIITCGADMKKIIEAKIKNSTIPVVSIPNWANVNELRYKSINDTKKIIIKFAGNIGRVQGVNKILNIIKKVTNPDINFVFQGSGACAQLVKDSETNNIIYKKSYKRIDEQNVLSESTIGLVSLDSGMYGLGVPSKTYNIMACGRPVLFIGPVDSEIYNLVKNYNLGWAFDINKEDEVLSFLNTLSINDLSLLSEKGMKARQVAENIFSKEKLLNRFYEEI